MVEQTLPSHSIRFFDFRPSACPPKQTFLEAEIHEYAIHEYYLGALRSNLFILEFATSPHTYEQGYRLQVSLYQYYSARGLIDGLAQIDHRFGHLDPVHCRQLYTSQYIQYIYIAQRQIILYLLWFKMEYRADFSLYSNKENLP